MKIRVVVPVYNEELFLPHFLKHYDTWVDEFVIWDNESTDRTADIARSHPKVVYRTFHTDAYDELSVLARLEETKAEGAYFDWVIFPDADEFIVSASGVPEREILAGVDPGVKVVAPKGYCLMPGPGDKAINWRRNLVAQRLWGYQSRLYSKPVILRGGVTNKFSPGKHGIYGAAEIGLRSKCELLLLHLEQIDFDHWVYRKNRRPLSSENVKNQWATDRFCRSAKEHRRIWDRDQGKLEKLYEKAPPRGLRA